MPGLAETKVLVNYESIIPWARLEAHIRMKIREELALLKDAETLEALHKAKGVLSVWEKLLNLPGTLTILDQGDKTDG